jgi:hypothetical protein
MSSSSTSINNGKPLSSSSSTEPTKRKKRNVTNASPNPSHTSTSKSRERSSSNSSGGKETTPLLNSYTTDVSSGGDRVMREIYSLRLSRISVKLTLSLVLTTATIIVLLAVLAIAISLLIYLVLYPYHNYFNETFTIDRNHLINTNTIVSTINGVIRQGLATYDSNFQFYPTKFPSCHITNDGWERGENAIVKCTERNSNIDTNNTITAAHLILQSENQGLDAIVYVSHNCIHIEVPGSKGLPNSFCLPGATITLYHSQQIFSGMNANGTMHHNIGILFGSVINNVEDLNLITARWDVQIITFDDEYYTIKSYPKDGIVYASFATAASNSIVTIYRSKLPALVNNIGNVQLCDYVPANLNQQWSCSSLVTVADSSSSASIAAVTTQSLIVATESYIHNIKVDGSILRVVDSKPVDCPLYSYADNRHMNRIYNMKVASSCTGAFLISCRGQLLAGYIQIDTNQISLADNGFSKVSTSLSVDTRSLQLTSPTTNIGCDAVSNCSQTTFGVTFKTTDGGYYSVQCSVYKLIHITCSNPFAHLYTSDTYLTTATQRPTYTDQCTTELSVLSLVEYEGGTNWQLETATWFGGITIAGISTQTGANFDDNNLQGSLPSSIKIAQKGVITLQSNPVKQITSGSRLYATPSGFLTSRRTKTPVGFAMTSTQLIMETSLVFPASVDEDDERS